MANVNPKMILANLENVSKQFSQLSAVKQKRWLHVLRGLTNGANMEFIIETLEHLDSVQLEHFMKLCRDKGIIQGEYHFDIFGFFFHLEYESVIQSVLSTTIIIFTP